VDKIGRQCNQKCTEELQCTQLLYWELKNGKFAVPGNGKADETQRLLLSLTSQLYDEMRDTIASNVLLKCHHFFLVDMQRNLSGEILRDVSSFNDSVMAEMFDLKATKENLRQEEDREKQQIVVFSEKENQLRDLSAQFTRFKLVPSVTH